MRIIAALLAALIAAPALAGDRDHAMMRGYMKWIAANSPLSYDGYSIPALVRVPERELHIMLYGLHWVEESERPNSNTTLLKVQALYHAESDTIYVPTGFDVVAWETAPIIVHELVHVLQDWSGVMPDCPGESEPQAYKIQAAWMDAHEHPGRRPNMLIPMLNASRCSDPH